VVGIGCVEAPVEFFILVGDEWDAGKSVAEAAAESIHQHVEDRSVPQVPSADPLLPHRQGGGFAVFSVMGNLVDEESDDDGEDEAR